MELEEDIRKKEYDIQELEFEVNGIKRKITKLNLDIQGESLIMRTN